MGPLTRKEIREGMEVFKEPFKKLKSDSKPNSPKRIATMNKSVFNQSKSRRFMIAK